MPTVSTSNPATSAFDYQDWQQGYRSQLQEFDYWIDEIEGTIPQALNGTLFRNGPGLLDVNGQRVHHPFDGDGMVCAITLTNGQAHFRNRFVRTKGFVEEQAAGRILYRGVFGTQKPGGWLANLFDLRLKNIANTQVIYWGGKLLALWEAAEPHRLDPETLDTLGTELLDGVLAPGDAFAAHPRLDPSCKWADGAPRLVNFSIKPGLSTAITIYELDLTGKVVEQHTHSVPGFAFMHDFAITPNYCLFFQSPVQFNPLPFVLGWRSPGECLKIDTDKPTRILVIPRHPGAGTQVQTLEVQAGFVFHHANAFEQNGAIVVDSICYDSFPSLEHKGDYREVDFTALPPGQLWRFQLDLAAATVQRQCLESRCCEFPFVHPVYMGRPYRYVFMGAAHAPAGNAPLQALLKIDLETTEHQLWTAAPRGFVGEPVFVPKPDAHQEDEGWVLSLVYDASCDRSKLVILDGQRLTQGPIAQLYLKHHVPYGLHGTFTPQTFVAARPVT